MGTSQLVGLPFHPRIEIRDPADILKGFEPEV
jgi:hypothetical protein